MGCALPTPGPRERSTFHIKEHEERRLDQGHLLRHPSLRLARCFLPTGRNKKKKLAEFLCSCLPWGGGGGPKALGEGGPEGPPPHPQNPLRKEGVRFFVLCLLGIPEPCGPPLQASPPCSSTVPRVYFPLVLRIPQVSRLGVLFIQCNASQLAINSILKLHIYIYIYCNILCNIAGSSSRHQSSVYRVYLCPRFLRSTSRQIRAEVSVKQNHRQIPAKTCKNNDQT